MRSDYEGLGTPGPHPYLIGPSEGRSMVEIVTAARQLDKSLGTSLIVAGHSQGGQSGLFAAPLVASLTPKIKLKGVLVYAPASHFYQQKNVASFVIIAQFSERSRDHDFNFGCS